MLTHFCIAVVVCDINTGYDTLLLSVVPDEIVQLEPTVRMKAMKECIYIYCTYSTKQVDISLVLCS